MTKRDLIDAYVAGRLERRRFVRGLTALGVSAGAAFAYARQLDPTAAAGLGTNAAGFVVRAQVDDGEYATACQLASDLDGVLAALAALALVEAVLARGLADFALALDELPPLEDLGLNTADVLRTTRAQVGEQIAALETLVADLGGTATTGTVTVQNFASVDSFLTALAGVLTAAAARFAGIAPAIQNPEIRQTLTSVAIVVGRHVGFANVLTGDTPAATAFEQPTCP
ncbi:MAG: hypothetical protein ACRDJW_00805 [Thermomicrobiales bacterium]